MPPSQKMPYPFFDLFIHHFERLGTPQSKVRFPASQLLIQLVARTSSQGAPLQGFKCSPTFCLIRFTLFFDGLQPMYCRPVRRLKCGPNV